MKFAFGYGATRLSIEELESKVTWNRLHPEFRRRIHLMMVAAQNAGTDLGIGTGFRSTAEQRRMFLDRYVVDPAGKISWDGRRWSKKPGVAAAAPPGRSYHEETDQVGFAFAADMVGDLRWMHQHCARFGLKHFASVNNEPWHIQPVEFPNSRSQWAGRQLSVFSISGAPVPDPQPNPALVFAYPGRPVRLGSKGVPVELVQAVVGATVDGDFGAATERRVKAWQKAHNLLDDGVVGARTWKAMFG